MTEVAKKVDNKRSQSVNVGKRLLNIVSQSRDEQNYSKYGRHSSKVIDAICNQKSGGTVLPEAHRNRGNMRLFESWQSVNKNG